MDVLQRTLESIVKPDAGVEYEALKRLADQARPAGSLGVLEPLSARLAGIAGTLDVSLKKKVIVTCAGDHGVVEEGVSLFPQEVTSQMVYNFVNGGASISVLAKHAGASVMVADLGVNATFNSELPIFHKKIGHGTQNFAKGPAMKRTEAVQAIEAGIAIVDEIVAEDGSLSWNENQVIDICYWQKKLIDEIRQDLEAQDNIISKRLLRRYS